MKEYAKYIDEKTISIAIPKTLELSGVQYRGDLRSRPDILSAFDFFQVEPDPEQEESPIAEDGYHIEERYRQGDSFIYRRFIVVQDDPRNLSLSKRKLMNAFKSLGIWTQVKAFLEANDYWDDFDMATTLDEQEEMMQRAINALKTAFSLSEETIENIIVNSIAE